MVQEDSPQGLGREQELTVGLCARDPPACGEIGFGEKMAQRSGDANADIPDTVTKGSQSAGL